MLFSVYLRELTNEWVLIETAEVWAKEQEQEGMKG